MGTFGTGLWGGAGGGGITTGGVQLATLIDPMLRIAGITTLPGTTPNIDQRDELIPMVNNLLSSWNVNGHRIYTSSIEAFPLVVGQKIYTIGPGADFDTERPLYIKAANTLFPTSPVVRRPIQILQDDEWAAIAVQDIPGAPPYQLYYDAGLDADGRANIYLRFQAPAGYSLEIYTWKALQTSFTTVDDFAVLPPGYANALILNGALQVAELYPLESRILPSVERRAMLALQAVMTLNTDMPRISTEPGFESSGDGRDQGGRGWLDGSIR